MMKILSRSKTAAHDHGDGDGDGADGVHDNSGDDGTDAENHLAPAAHESMTMSGARQPMRSLGGSNS